MSTTAGGAAVWAQRAQILVTAHLAHPERFVRKPPVPPKLPGASWINQPQEKDAIPQ
jgi:putative transposase